MLIVDFEATKDGEISEGFTKQGGCEASSVKAHSGKNCLRMNPAELAARWPSEDVFELTGTVEPAPFPT